MVVPNLMDLMFDKGHNCLRFRLTLLKWLIFDDIHSTLDIEEIPTGYMVLLLTLMYLLGVRHSIACNEYLIYCLMIVHRLDK